MDDEKAIAGTDLGIAVQRQKKAIADLLHWLATWVRPKNGHNGPSAMG